MLFATVCSLVSHYYHYKQRFGVLFGMKNSLRRFKFAMTKPSENVFGGLFFIKERNLPLICMGSRPIRANI